MGELNPYEEVVDSIGLIGHSPHNNSSQKDLDIMLAGMGKSRAHLGFDQ